MNKTFSEAADISGDPSDKNNWNVEPSIVTNNPLRRMSNDTIAAISTPAGVGGIAVIRISGPEAIATVDSAWKGKALQDVETHTVHLGKYYDINGNVLDECVATIFLSPNTFTGEDVVELSVHGSRWIQREILADLVRRGIRIADAGEFTRRAFLNGKIDLAQAEGIADLIAASSKAAHSLAISQTRGHFSRALEQLREQLIEFASLLELELDFSEEDVEFADRQQLLNLSGKILKELERLSKSYSSGSVIKEGVPVAIAGVPNAGKSSLLNLLLNDDKAIVSDIPGTTRDTIEDTVEIDGVLYRFIDTAGLRESDDKVETIGIERAKARILNARIIIWLFDSTAPLAPQQEELEKILRHQPDATIIRLENKADLHPTPVASTDSEATFTPITSTPLAFSSIKDDSTEDSWAVTAAEYDSIFGTVASKHEEGSHTSILAGDGVHSPTVAPDMVDADPPIHMADVTTKSADGEAHMADITIHMADVTTNSTDAAPQMADTSLHMADVTTKSADAEPHMADTSLHMPNVTTNSADAEPHMADVTTSYATVAINDEIESYTNGIIRFSTKTEEGLEQLKQRLTVITKSQYNPDTDIIVTNARHYEAIIKGADALRRAIEGLENGISGDFIAQDVREALHHLGTITGAITTPTLLHSIFSRFCIGK